MEFTLCVSVGIAKTIWCLCDVFGRSLSTGVIAAPEIDPAGIGTVLARGQGLPFGIRKHAPIAIVGLAGWSLLKGGLKKLS